MIDKAEVRPKSERTEKPQDEQPVARIPNTVLPPKTTESFPSSFLKFFRILKVTRIFIPTNKEIRIRA